MNTMKVVIAIDSFKGSLTSPEAGLAAKEGILSAIPTADVEVCHVADGGEGTVSAIVHGGGGEMHIVSVTGPLGESVEAELGIIPSTRTAVIEMSSAAGITLIESDKRNPLFTTTYGVGELIRCAIHDFGCRRFIVGIGGSATNDGGVGMLEALGFEFLDKNGEKIRRGAIGLSEICSIKCDGSLPELRECEFAVACDVTNPLLGSDGCSAVFGPQKGATPEMAQDMDTWLTEYARLTEEVTGRNYKDTPGAGAAGGLGFALLSYLNAELKSGIDLVLSAINFEEKVKDADIVITGEGRLDYQSSMGKAPVGVAKAAKKYNVPTIAFSGCIGRGAEECNKHGIDAFFPIIRTICSLDEAMNRNNAYNNLKNTAEQVFRLIDCKTRIR